jgi:hypothetical protein
MEAAVSPLAEMEQTAGAPTPAANAQSGSISPPSEIHEFTATADEWRAFCMMGDIREIASPRFARLVNFAHAEGLLAPMLAGDSEAVQRRASELLDTLSAQIHSQYPATPIQHPRQLDDRVAAEGEFHAL